MDQDEQRISRLEEKVRGFVKERKLLEADDCVLAGVSGGADSVCLLFMLLCLKGSMDGRLTVEVAHVHHGLRGKDADADMEYTRKLCERLEVPFHGVHCDVAKIARERGMTAEEAGRAVRYREFARIAGERGLQKIATAHHKDDAAETILMNLFRGSGLRGVSGIQPGRGNLIRPLLALSRKEVEEYLRLRGVAWCQDATNQDNSYTRNRVRNELLPYVERHINARAAQHIVWFGQQAEQLDAYMQRKACDLFEKCGNIDGKRVILKLDCLLAQTGGFEKEKPLLAYVVRECISRTGAGLKDVTHQHIEQVFEIMAARTGASASLPGELVVEKSYETLLFFRKGCENVPAGKPSFTITVKKMKNISNFPKKKYTKWIDYDKIKFTLQFRTRAPGDFLVINEAGGRKKLKDYFIDCKIPRSERDEVMLLADGPEIVWVVGYRLSERYKVTQNTRLVAEVVCEGLAEEDNGGMDGCKDRRMVFGSHN